MSEGRFTDWRALFSEIRVDWRDRGKNTSKGNVNIHCPFCGDDIGYHLSVSEKAESDGAYFCYRDNRHRGANPLALLYALGQPRSEGRLLINKHLLSVPVSRVQLPRREQVGRWPFFEPLSDAGSRYLAKRGFEVTPRFISAYDLRSSPAGKWACRALLPMSDGEKQSGWTGRSWRPDLEPKYLTEAPGGSICLPRPARSTLIVVEGPLDALKINHALEREDISALAMGGKHLGPAALAAISRAARAGKAARLLLLPDADVRAAQRLSMAAELRMVAVAGRMQFGLASLPAGVKDAAEMDYAGIRAWMRGI